MTEGEYLRVSNLARLRDAYAILEKLYADYGVTVKEKKLLLTTLDTAQERISSTIKTTEVKR